MAKKKAKPSPKSARQSARRPTGAMRAGSKKQARLPKPSSETFTLDYPKPEPAFHDRMIAPPEEKLELPAPVATRSIEKKKEMPRAATAMILAGLLTLIFVSAFTFVLGVGLLLSFALAVPLFVGFSIFLYNFFESR